MINSHLARWSCAALLAISSAALGQSFPSKPIRFVIGPSSDVLPRLIGQKLSTIWGQQVLVDPRPGAAGAIAVDTVARAPADGYTWLLTSASFVITENVVSPPPFNITQDFEPVALLSSATFYLAVHPSVPARSVAELIQLARSRPGKLNYASAGNGTPPHLAGEMLKTMAGVDIVHVPYKNSAAAIADVMGGQVEMTFQFAPVVLPHVKSGRLVPLAVTSARRTAAAPDLPTVAESGLAGFEMTGWTGVHVPAGTPRPVIAAINAAIREALSQPDVQQKLSGAGLEPPDAAGNTPQAFGSLYRSDAARWSKLIKQAGIRGN